MSERIIVNIVSGEYGAVHRLIAGTWAVTTEGMLQVVRDSKPVAEYAPGRWASVTDETASAGHASAGKALAEVRERLENLASGLGLPASATAPSKKSDIEASCARAVREIANRIEA